MKVIRLTKLQIEKIYNKHLVYDFAEDERKPLSMILKAVEKNAYECLGITDREHLVGYAFFVKTGEDYMLEYLAVVRGLRDQGIGSSILQELSAYCHCMESLICEVENPVYAKQEDELILRERRKNFYQRNGFIDTGVDVQTWGVEYRLMELPLGKIHTTTEIKALYQKHYSAILPKVLYKLKIKIR